VKRAAATRKKPVTGALYRLARAAGVQLSYTDVSGREQCARTESVVAVLRGLGIPLDHPDQAAGALAALHKERRSRACEPVVVAWEGQAAALKLRLTAGSTRSGVRCVLTLEDGGELRWTVSPRDLERATARGVADISLPGDLPLGAHRLTIEVGPKLAHSTVLAAPCRSFAREHAGSRQLGVFLPLYSVRSERNWGVGDLGDLQMLGEWSAASGCGFVGTLPLLASFLDEPFDPSPYSPASRLFWNELFLDVEAAPEFEGSAAARRIVASAAFQEPLEKLRSAKLVDYKGAYRLKRRVLDVLAAAAFGDAKRRRQIDRFAAAVPTAREYAAFRAVGEAAGCGWRQWDDRLRQGTIRSGDYAEGNYRTHLYAQFLLTEQLDALGGPSHGHNLYLDLPIGVHADGFDTWRFRDAFAQGLTVGAPPDALFRGGQNWGFPPPHPHRARLDGHAYFRASVRTLMARSSALRIDHVMGLHRLFCIPGGMGGADGVYIRQPAEELYAALMIESHRAQAEIVGENLGTVPPEVDKELDRRGILKMYVGLFEFRPKERPVCRVPGRETLASLNTHDTPTLAAFWSGSEIYLRERLGLLTVAAAAKERRAHTKLVAAIRADLSRAGLLERGEDDPSAVATAMLRLLAASPARKVLVNLEDLWGEELPQNVPGVHEGVPNWRRKAARTLEAILSDPALGGTLMEVARLRSDGEGARRGGAAKNQRSGKRKAPTNGPRTRRTRERAGT